MYECSQLWFMRNVYSTNFTIQSKTHNVFMIDSVYRDQVMMGMNTANSPINV